MLSKEAERSERTDLQDHEKLLELLDGRLDSGLGRDGLLLVLVERLSLLLVDNDALLAAGTRESNVSVWS